MSFSPQEISQWEELRIQADRDEVDLALSAQALGLATDDSAIVAFRRRRQEELHSAERRLLGFRADEGLPNFDSAQRLLAVVEEVASFAVFSATPMTGEQSEELTRILAKVSRNKPLTLTSIDWEAALIQASATMSEAQLTGLRVKTQQARLALLLSQFYSRPRPPR